MLSLLDRRPQFQATPFLTNTQTAMDQVGRQFSDQLLAPPNLAAIAVGGLAYRLGKLGALNLGFSSWVAPVLGIAAEVTAFRGAERLFDPQMAVFKNKEWWATALDFSTLRIFGHLSPHGHPLLAYFVQSNAFVLSHRLSNTLGLRSVESQGYIQDLAEAMRVTLQMQASAALLAKVTGHRWQFFEKNLELRSARWRASTDRRILLQQNSNPAMASDKPRRHPAYPELLWVPPGNFSMGNPEVEAECLDELPSRRIHLRRGFWLGENPVTNEQFAHYVADPMVQEMSLGLFLDFQNGDVILLQTGIFKEFPLKSARRELLCSFDRGLENYLKGNETWGNQEIAHDPELPGLLRWMIHEQHASLHSVVAKYGVAVNTAAVSPGRDYLQQIEKHFPGMAEPELPAVWVNWYEAMGYAAWKYPGGSLPTEAQWEKAARGDFPPSSPEAQEIAERMRQGTWSSIGRSKPLEVTASVYRPEAPRGPYGHRDLLGNVWEWTSSWYDANYYRTMPHWNPLGPGKPSRKEDLQKSIRGGSHYSRDPRILRPFTRESQAPDVASPDLGFRVWMSSED